jgi:hypothetical protein
MLFVSFIIIFVLTNISNEALTKYPLPADCTTLLGYGEYDEMLDHATSSWI